MSEPISERTALEFPAFGPEAERKKRVADAAQRSMDVYDAGMKAQVDSIIARAEALHAASPQGEDLPTMVKRLILQEIFDGNKYERPAGGFGIPPVQNRRIKCIAPAKDPESKGFVFYVDYCIDIKTEDFYLEKIQVGKL